MQGKASLYRFHWFHGLFFAFCFLVFSFAIVHTSVHAAASYYVSSSGSDTNSGSQSSPWKTIQKAENTANSGDTVIVSTGTYTERVSVTRPGITFQAQGTVTMNGFHVTADNAVVNGFEITNSSNSDEENGTGVYVRAKNCTIENNYVHDTAREGILLSDSSLTQTATQNCTVKNNKVYHAEMAGIVIQGQNHLVEGNEVWGTEQYGPLWPNPPSYIDADGLRYFGSGHTFRNNYIHDIPSDGVINVDPHTDCFQTWGDPAVGHDILFDSNLCVLPFDNNAKGLRAKAWQEEGGAYNLTMRNNIIHTNMAGLFNGAHDITFLNNTFVGTLGDDAQGIHFTNALNVTAKNNIFAYLENGVSQLYNEGGSTITAGNNCVYKVGGNRHDPGDVNGSDPLFVNTAAGDYHLKANSPCIDKGVSDGVSTDKDGNARPQSAGYDMGAYEYTVSGFGAIITQVPATNTPTATPVPTTTLTPTPIPIRGDANGDRAVNESDYAIWLSHYNQHVTGGSGVGDFNGDGVVDGVDYVLWLVNYGK
jgi:parallel beta-helix repeat protein